MRRSRPTHLSSCTSVPYAPPRPRAFQHAPSTTAHATWSAPAAHAYARTMCRARRPPLCFRRGARRVGICRGKVRSAVALLVLGGRTHPMRHPPPPASPPSSRTSPARPPPTSSARTAPKSDRAGLGCEWVRYHAPRGNAGQVSVRSVCRTASVLCSMCLPGHRRGAPSDSRAICGGGWVSALRHRGSDVQQVLT